MNNALRLTAFAACLLTTFPIQAARFSYPSEDKEWFTVDIPASWKPEIDDDGTLSASSPDDDAYLAFWTVETKDDINSLGDDIEEWMKDDLKKIKIDEKPIEKSVNGIEFTIFNGTAVKKDGNEKVGFEIFLFSPKKGKVGVFYCEYGEDAPDSVKQLIKIVESIQLKKK